MLEPIFEDPRLVAIYDHFDGDRKDLVHYLALVKELKVRSILDIGCGTGCFPHLLASEGFEVIGVEPALASLDFARSKKEANKIHWIHGDSSQLPPLAVDLAVMTGNVAQVFTTNEAWEKNLKDIYHALKSGGRLVFEVRDPTKKSWLEWTKEKTFCRQNIPNIGFVEGWCEIIDIKNDLVSFRWTYIFQSDGEVITSDSTLRFRSREEIETSLKDSGYTLDEVRGAPDRPGKEFVFIATKKS